MLLNEFERLSTGGYCDDESYRKPQVSVRPLPLPLTDEVVRMVMLELGPGSAQHLRRA